jgi:nicotinate-nucleotide adenylyltransferase
LGGSFNPAHAGHVAISRMALERLVLDEVWWLVSPQNPLKPTADMAPLAERLAVARQTAQGMAVVVTDAEVRLGTRYTADTLPGLQRAHPDTNFVWLMGADNLVQMRRWRRWSSIFCRVPIAVFARPAYALRAKRAKAARYFAEFRMQERDAAYLADQSPPAWVLFKGPRVSVSATDIRRQRENVQNKGVRP